MPASIQMSVLRALSSPMMSVLFPIFAWVLMLLSGNALISWLKRLKGMKWTPREDTPESHGAKAGVPSMGGLGIVGAAILSLIAAVTVIQGLIRLIGMSSVGQSMWDWVGFTFFPVCVLGHCALGFTDDWSKAKRRGGLSSKAKLLGQIVLAGLFLLAVRSVLPHLTQLIAKEDGFLYFGWGIGLVCLLLIIGTSNAVNLTDGIDGLAAGLSVQVALVFGVLFLETFGTSEVGFFASSAEVFWLCLGGGCLGFLAFNKNPAKVFMGDTGSLALGAALGAGAILTRSVFLLPFIGFIFYIEMFSVIAQVAYFKLTKKKFGEGRRIFRRAPLHHHFELGGWSEWRGVGTFWAINALTTILGLILWKMGILPRFP